jgi:hypothetical protein
MAQRITKDEYEKQSSDFTKRELEKLNKQLASAEYKPRKRRAESDSNSGSDTDDLVAISINTGKTKSKAKTKTRDDLTYVELIKENENSLKQIKKLEIALDKLELETNSLDVKLHHMKLDLSNKSVDFENLTNKYNSLCAETAVYKRQTRKLICYMALLIIILFIIILV